jgi:hypothetical protein
MIIPNLILEKIHKIIYTGGVQLTPLLPMCQPNGVKAKVKRDYSFTCQLCFEVFDAKELNAHHILPKEDGGLTIPENLKPLCFDTCHPKVHRDRITHNKFDEVILIIVQKQAIIIPLFSLPQQEPRTLTLAA